MYLQTVHFFFIINIQIYLICKLYSTCYLYETPISMNLNTEIPQLHGYLPLKHSETTDTLNPRGVTVHCYLKNIGSGRVCLGICPT